MRNRVLRPLFVALAVMTLPVILFGIAVRSSHATQLAAPSGQLLQLCVGDALSGTQSDRDKGFLDLSAEKHGIAFTNQGYQLGAIQVDEVVILGNTTPQYLGTGSLWLADASYRPIGTPIATAKPASTLTPTPLKAVETHTCTQRPNYQLAIFLTPVPLTPTNFYVYYQSGVASAGNSSTGMRANPDAGLINSNARGSVCTGFYSDCFRIDSIVDNAGTSNTNLTARTTPVYFFALWDATTPTPTPTDTPTPLPTATPTPQPPYTASGAFSWYLAGGIAVALIGGLMMAFGVPFLVILILVGFAINIGVVNNIINGTGDYAWIILLEILAVAAWLLFHRASGGSTDE